MKEFLVTYTTLIQLLYNSYTTLIQLLYNSYTTLITNSYSMSYTTLYNQYINFQDPEDQVSDMLDTLQHTEQEYQALQDLIYHTHTSKDTDEYEPFNQDIMIGGFDKDVRDEEYVRTLDRNEMRGDMFSFEDENKSHELFAENTWEDRSFHSDYHIVNKKSEVTIDATVTKR